MNRSVRSESGAVIVLWRMRVLSEMGQESAVSDGEVGEVR